MYAENGRGAMAHLLLLAVFLPLCTQSQPVMSFPPLQLRRSIPYHLTCNVLDYGAIGDGLHLETTAIQAAIDGCASIGDGRLIFPAGQYLTGTVFLKSGVTLVVEKGAVILGSRLQKDYPAESKQWYVILAEGAERVGITGGGVIDGQALKFVERFEERKNVMVSWNITGDCLGDECRPRLVGFIGCRDVHVWDVKFSEPAYWCLHIVRCCDTSIHDISIHGDFNIPNNDGIDIEDSNNTLITRCHIDTGDDAICPKTYYGPLYNLTASDCWIRTKSSAVKLGSASWLEFRNLTFDNLTIVDSHRGLGLQIRDGGKVSDVTFSNIKISTRYYDPSWWGRAEPIYVTTCPRDSKSKAGLISNLQFINITAISENGIFLSGSTDSLLSNIRFTNVNLTYRRWTKYRDGLVDYRPGCRGLVNRSMAGIIMEHISDLDMVNINMRWHGNGLKGWDKPMDFTPSTINSIHFAGFQSEMCH
ncbi:probable polygalacturonase [Amborella trichopoda]|uniref:Pectate lyase superfamily protein domain-containing protein n=1 Tax=Amborella trichopoda TaxID=13333 RepID=W1PWJ6_AMBTC|nr:probable polygalacturonase [Amborella trichopoda]ERN11715.1 hypothetical protein AMTR_s00022p00232100 [Amborella trichopoda]|eukprot:XP_006850134.1 probable polygalacturonase [Amborella trichopoda]